MQFLALDFETANESRISACELGLALVENGVITERKSWLIRPPELRFGWYETKVHGLKVKDVENEPTFDQLWPEMAPFFEDRLLMAHNAAFDMGVLRALLMHYKLPVPQVSTTCSVRIARKTWPHLQKFRLNLLAAQHDIALQHHRALSDAVACAEIALVAFREKEIQKVEEIEEKLNIRFGWL